jgi:hypothetical protein
MATSFYKKKQRILLKINDWQAHQRQVPPEPLVREEEKFQIKTVFHWNKIRFKIA